MLTHFVRKVHGQRPLVRPRLVIGVPPEITPVERRAVKDSGYRVKASEVHLVDEPDGGGDRLRSPGDRGSRQHGHRHRRRHHRHRRHLAGGTVYGRSLRVAGNKLDDSIIQHMKRAHQLLIGERTAEHIKCEIGSAAPLDDRLTMEVKGRHLTAGVPRTITIHDAEIRDAMAEPIRSIVQAVRDALERVPPELCADIYDRGVVLTGGGALLRNLDKRLRDETGLPVLVAENPLTSVVLGAAKMLSDLNLLRKVSSEQRLARACGLADRRFARLRSAVRHP